MRKTTPPDLGPTELMKAMGAPSWNPIPPDQTKWPAKYKVPLFRLWSYMCDHSIRKGRRKGYVCDDNGNPVTIENAARSLQMDPGFCRRLFREGIALGLWRRGPKGEGESKIILNGRVSKPAYIEPEDRISDDEIPGGEEDDGGAGPGGEDKAKPSFEKVCTDLSIPPYIQKKLKELPSKNRKLFFTEYAREFQGEKDMHADLTAANRLLWSPRKDRVFEKFGIEKIREIHKTKDGKPREPRPPEREKFVQAVLPGLEEHVKGYLPLNSVQTAGDGGSVQDQNDSVQATSLGKVQTSKSALKSGVTLSPVGVSENGDERAILEPLKSSLSAASNKRNPSSSSSLKTDDDEQTKPASQKTRKQAEDWDAVGQAAGQYFTVDDAWIQMLVARCRERAPDITPAELAQLVHVKGPLAVKKESPGGFLRTAVPNLCEGESFRRFRNRLREANEQQQQRTCACGQPINIDGQCWACYEREHVAAQGAGRQ